MAKKSTPITPKPLLAQAPKNLKQAGDARTIVSQVVGTGNRSDFLKQGLTTGRPQKKRGGK
jgi:hypothetical protein